MTSSLRGVTYWLDSDNTFRSRGWPDVPKLTTVPDRVGVRINRLRALGSVTPPVEPETPVGYLPPITASDITLMLAGTHPVMPSAVTFSSLQGGDTVATSTHADGGVIRNFTDGQFQQIITRCPAGKIIVLDPGTYVVNQPDWDAVGAGGGAVRVPKTCAGMVGRTPPGKSWSDLQPTTVRSVIRVLPMTGPAQNAMPAWFQVGFSGSIRFDFANIHWEGTEQGTQFSGGGGSGPGIDNTSRRLFTNVYLWNQQPGCTMRDVLSTGSFGNNGAPPGETFNIEWYHSTGGTASRIYTDGRRANDRVIYSAVGFTFGQSIDCTLSDAWLHHNAFAGHVHFRTLRCKTYSMTLGDPSDHISNHVSVGRTKGDWLNHELTDGNEHWDLLLNCFSVGGAQVAHVTHSNGNTGGPLTQWNTGATFPQILGNGTLKMVDVQWSNIIRSGRLGIEAWNPYGGVPETIGPPNTPQVVYRSGAKIPGVDWKYDAAGTWVTIQ